MITKCQGEIAQRRIAEGEEINRIVRKMEEEKRIYHMELRQYETRISELEAVVREQSIHSI